MHHNQCFHPLVTSIPTQSVAKEYLKDSICFSRSVFLLWRLLFRSRRRVSFRRLDSMPPSNITSIQSHHLSLESSAAVTLNWSEVATFDSLMPLADYSDSGVIDYYDSMVINANDIYHICNLLLKLTTSIVLKENQSLQQIPVDSGGIWSRLLSQSTYESLYQQATREALVLARSVRLSFYISKHDLVLTLSCSKARIRSCRIF